MAASPALGVEHLRRKRSREFLVSVNGTPIRRASASSTNGEGEQVSTPSSKDRPAPVDEWHASDGDGPRLAALLRENRQLLADKATLAAELLQLKTRAGGGRKESAGRGDGGGDGKDTDAGRMRKERWHVVTVSVDGGAGTVTCYVDGRRSSRERSGARGVTPLLHDRVVVLGGGKQGQSRGGTPVVETFAARL